MRSRDVRYRASQSTDSVNFQAHEYLSPTLGTGRTTRVSRTRRTRAFFSQPRIERRSDAAALPSDWQEIYLAGIGMRPAGHGVRGTSRMPRPRRNTRSTANIEITQDTADQFRMDTGGGYDSGYIDVTKLDTEIAILKSSTLAMQTIKSLHLDQNKDFLPLGSNRCLGSRQNSGSARSHRDVRRRFGGPALWAHQYSRPQLHRAQSGTGRGYL